jgi:GT2 family glycosyltransferase
MCLLTASPSHRPDHMDVHSPRKTRDGVPTPHKTRDGVPTLRKARDGVPTPHKTRDGVPTLRKARDGAPTPHKTRDGVPTTKTLVIIPAHNEATNIGQVLAEIDNAKRTLALISPQAMASVSPQAMDVLVVDDCSTDATASVAAQAGARVLHLPNNLGYGGAVQAGFKYAVHYGYDFGVLMDADGQHDASCIGDLLRVVQSGEADVALGSRFLGRMKYKTTFAKRLGMSFFSTVVSRLTGRRITDPTSGFQALNRDTMVFFAADNYPVDFPDADTILLLHFAGFRVAEVPVVMRERLSGQSMHSSWKPIYYVFKMFLAILIVLLRQTTHTNAMRQRAGLSGAPGTPTGSGGAEADEGQASSHPAHNPGSSDSGNVARRADA